MALMLSLETGLTAPANAHVKELSITQNTIQLHC